MNGIVILLHTLLTRLLVVIIILPLIPVVLIAGLLSPVSRFSNTFLFTILDFFYNIVLRCLLVPVEYEWLDTISKEPAVIIANHQSSLDIVLIGVALKGAPHMWLARDELMNTFLLRWILAIFAQVINVHSPRATAVTLRNAIKLALASQAHVVLFPEGSRSSTGQLLPFFDGYILLAKKLNRPVIPLYIHNIANVYPRGSFFIKRVPVKVTIGYPFRLADYSDDNQFRMAIQNWFENRVVDISKKRSK